MIETDIKANSYKWVFQANDTQTPILIDSKSNKCNYIGAGIYTLITDNGNHTFDYSKGSDDDTTYKIEPTEKVTQKWDWSKLTTDQKKEAKSLLKKGNQKDMIVFQNKHNLSGNHICCAGDYVHHNFKLALKEGLI